MFTLFALFSVRKPRMLTVAFGLVKISRLGRAGSVFAGDTPDERFTCATENEQRKTARPRDAKKRRSTGRKLSRLTVVRGNTCLSFPHVIFLCSRKIYLTKLRLQGFTKILQLRNWKRRPTRAWQEIWKYARWISFSSLSLSLSRRNVSIDHFSCS